MLWTIEIGLYRVSNLWVWNIKLFIAVINISKEKKYIYIYKNQSIHHLPQRRLQNACGHWSFGSCLAFGTLKLNISVACSNVQCKLHTGLYLNDTVWNFKTYRLKHGIINGYLFNLIPFFATCSFPGGVQFHATLFGFLWNASNHQQYWSPNLPQCTSSRRIPKKNTNPIMVLCFRWQRKLRYESAFASSIYCRPSGNNIQHVQTAGSGSYLNTTTPLRSLWLPRILSHLCASCEFYHCLLSWRQKHFENNWLLDQISSCPEDFFTSSCFKLKF